MIGDALAIQTNIADSVAGALKIALGRAQKHCATALEKLPIQAARTSCAKM